MPKKTRMTAPEVKTNTDEVDVKKCGAHFETCGWDSLEFDPRYAYTNHLYIFWAARCIIRLLIELMPKAVVFPFL